MAKGLPYFCWYPSDADTDENFRAMTDEQVGFYLRCLNHTWINGSLPADQAEAARVMNRSQAKFSALWKRVGRCFVPMEADNSRIVNPRQERERAAAKAQRGKQSEGGKSSAAKRWGTYKSPIGEQQANQPLRASDSVYESVSSGSQGSAEGISKIDMTIKTPVIPDSGPLFSRMINAFLNAGVKLSENDLIDASRGNRDHPGFLQHTTEDQLAIAQAAEELARTTSARGMGLPVNFIGYGRWRRRGPGRLIPEPGTIDKTAERIRIIRERRGHGPNS